MHRGDALGSSEQNWHTIGRDHSQRQPATCRDQGIAWPVAAAGVCIEHIGRMHLLEPRWGDLIRQDSTQGGIPRETWAFTHEEGFGITHAHTPAPES